VRKTAKIGIDELSEILKPFIPHINRYNVYRCLKRYGLSKLSVLIEETEAKETHKLFNDVARAVLAWHGRGKIEYIPFPAHLKGCYQSFTEADMTALRKIGYNQPFKTVEEGVKLYLDWLN